MPRPLFERGGQEPVAQGRVREAAGLCGYPADADEGLAKWAVEGLTLAVDWRLFGVRGRPWGRGQS